MLNALDLVVMAGYGLGMLLVGFYFSKRTKNTEDFLLGGRKMNPVAVGLSLFATMLSAITYLGCPGEIIKHGPMFFVGILVYPLVFLIVGWILIPRIMKLQISSAYELLEIKLGVNVRILSSVIFLLMRIAWMALIIYLTAQKVIIPLFGISSDKALLVSICVGLLTVVYTSMGGLRAVVLTDVIQTVILFGSAIVVIVIISIKLGGVGGWFPDKWLDTWDKPVIVYAPDARITMVGIMLCLLGWHVCVNGSDQMAIQRFLSTRDVKSARRVIATALVMNAVTLIVLALLGLALLAYFKMNMHLFPDVQDIRESADTLLLSFVTNILPPGVSGLVIAGLLAAAMSSLSSGINASSLVLSRDFIAHFRKKAVSDQLDVRLAKINSFMIGIAVAFVSLLIGKVKGNIIEVTAKVSDLGTATLFVPFFMALFIKKPSARATFAGTLLSLATAFIIAFWKEFGIDKFTGFEGLSFVWILPVALAIGVVFSIILGVIFPEKNTHS